MVSEKFMLVHKSTKITLFSKSLQRNTCNWVHYSSATFSSAQTCSRGFVAPL